MAILMGLRDGNANSNKSWPFKFKLDVKVLAKVMETVISSI